MPRFASRAQQFADYIDQLDLALDQLALSDRNFDRFAILLVDNVVELALHRFVELMRRSQPALEPGEPKPSPKELEEALGQRFDAKVRFARKNGLISQEVCESILLLHGYRNTAYHRGLRHEEVLHSLAVLYFRVACSVLAALPRSRGLATSRFDEISYRARKYVGSYDWGTEKEAFANAIARINDVAGSLPENLVGDLAADMRRSIKACDESLTFLSEYSPGKPSRDQVIVSTQAWHLAFTKKGIDAARAAGVKISPTGGAVSWFVNNHKWQTTTDPIPGWVDRLKNLEGEADYHKALKRYCDFMTQTEDLRLLIHESAGDLEMVLEQQADAARDAHAQMN